MDGDLMDKSGSDERKTEVSIVLCGQAGQGVQTVEFLLTRLLKLAGHHVFATKEYMSRVRGGLNSTTIRLSDRPVQAYVHRMDILVALNKGAVQHVAKRIARETIVLAESETIGDAPALKDCTLLEIPFEKIASELGNKIYSNIVAVGALAGLVGVDLDHVRSYVKRYFASKSEDVVASNVKAAEAGYAALEQISLPAGFPLEIETSDQVRKDVLLNGAEAVGLGALAGGCNFISAYPMSPSTAVLAFLARHGGDFGVVAEQAEDEIAAINMAVGAWYAGARAMVTTSGGGFALMTEGVSLAAMLETPVVIHLAQRPGPATGLPTRTEQGDLELALYAGHGEFPRIILAPGTLEDGFPLTQKAFNLADKYQVPVFILTDQYYIDSYYNTPAPDLADVRVEKHVVKTSPSYRRYEIVPEGVSPRGVPGYGDGLVVVDSDEHDEQGHITEDLDLRVRMVDKRLAKGESLMQDIVPPVLEGPENYKNLVVCWGSTYHAVKEGIARLGRSDTAMLHYKQVYPLHEDTAEYIIRADRAVVVEGNATGQFSKLIELHAGVAADDWLLKYSGLTFSAEEIADRLKDMLS